MSHIFVSYAYFDMDFASTLIRQLNSAGFATVDAEQVRPSGYAELEAAIENAFAMLVVFSPNVLDNAEIMYEWVYALGAKKNVIPVLLRPTELPQRLRPLPMLDFTDFVQRPWDELISHMARVRGDYVSSLIQIPQDTPAEIRAVLLQIESQNESERRTGLNVLADIEHAAALDVLANLTAHKRRDVRIYAALKLAARTRYHDERALAGLLEALNDAQEATQIEAIRALGKLGDAAAAGLLISVPEASTTVVRAVVDGLISALSHQNKDIRYEAAVRLGEIGDPTAVNALLAALHDPMINNRTAAAKALGKIGDPAAVDELVRMLKDEIALVRQAAAEALGKIGDPAAIPDLIKSLGEWNNDVRQAVASALGMIGDAAAVPRLLAVLRDERMGARGAAARALAMIGQPALPGLITELRNKDAYVRQYSATALGMIGDETAVPELVKMLNDLNEVNFVRFSAAEALVDMGAAGVPGLILALNDPDPEIREMAAGSLELIGTPEAYEALSAWQNAEEV